MRGKTHELHLERRSDQVRTLLRNSNLDDSGIWRHDFQNLSGCKVKAKQDIGQGTDLVSPRAGVRYVLHDNNVRKGLSGQLLSEKEQTTKPRSISLDHPDATVSHLHTDGNSFGPYILATLPEGSHGGTALLTHDNVQGNIHNVQLRKL